MSACVKFLDLSASSRSNLNLLALWISNPEHRSVMGLPIVPPPNEIHITGSSRASDRGGGVNDTQLSAGSRYSAIRLHTDGNVGWYAWLTKTLFSRDQIKFAADVLTRVLLLQKTTGIIFL